MIRWIIEILKDSIKLTLKLLIALIAIVGLGMMTSKNSNEL